MKAMYTDRDQHSISAEGVLAFEMLLDEIDSPLQFDSPTVADPVAFSRFDPALATKEFLTGHYYRDCSPFFVVVPKQWRKYPKRPEYVLPEVYQAFRNLVKKAEEQEAADKKLKGKLVPFLKIVSGVRSFEDQRIIWNRKTKCKPVTETCVKNSMKYSAMPGASRHHWGTDIDIWITDNDKFPKHFYEWLQKNAPAEGFCQPYTYKPVPGPSRPGYEEEKWHWSYLPIAKPLLARYVSLVRHEDLRCFPGAELAGQINVIGNYVKGIDLGCL